MDAQAECWLGICMWDDPDQPDGGGVNFAVDADVGAIITGVFTSLKVAANHE
jgi:hypothetical protein